MNKKTASRKSTAKSVPKKSAARNAKPASKKSISARKNAIPAPKKSTPARRNANLASKKSTPASRNAIPASKKSVPARKNSTLAPKETVPAFTEPDLHWNPVYLGTPHVLSKNIPAYMPGNIDALVPWIDNYLARAMTLSTKYPSILGGTSRFPINTLNTTWNNVNAAIANVNLLVDWTRSWRAYRNILLFSRENSVTPPLAAPPAQTLRGIAQFPAIIGVVSAIDWQVRMLRKDPAFNQTEADLLGIVPSAPHTPDPATLDPQVTARLIGGGVELRFRSPGHIRGVKVVEIWCQHGEGARHFVAATTRGSFLDTHEMPATRTTWTYYVWYANENGLRLGVESEASIIVP